MGHDAGADSGNRTSDCLTKSKPNYINEQQAPHLARSADVSARRYGRNVNLHRPLLGLALIPLLLAGCASGTSSDSPTTSEIVASEEGTPGKAATPQPAVTEPAATEPATAVAATPEPTTTDVAPAAPEAVTLFTMPDVVGQNLQYSQDSLQALGSYVMDQTDASGLGRMQIDDSNWVVCSQDPAPGSAVPISTVVTLSAVKIGEAC